MYTNDCGIFQEVTDNLVRLMEKGTAPWRKEWKGKGIAQGMPYNPFTKRNYSGVNVLQLWLVAAAKGYVSNAWGTYKQIREAGGQVRGGEKAARVVFFRHLEVKDAEGRQADQGEDATRFVPLMRVYSVFNAEQCDGLNLPKPKPLPEAQRIERAEAFIRSLGAKVQHGGDVACYRIGGDEIHLPVPQHFTAPEAYYATSLHEHTHWTGHKSRLDRATLGQRYGTEAYAFEELIAELGAAFLCAELGIQSDIENHASYLANWCRIMREDHRAVFRASAAAAKAAEFLKAKQPLQQQAAA
jgi:antirestriction protein ArdC